MAGASILELVAELAIGLLGFSGIVIAVGARSSAGLDPVRRSRFFTMVLIGALVEVLSLIPFGLYHAGLEAGALWGWASGIGAGIIVLVNRTLVRATPGAELRVIWSNPAVSKAAVFFGVTSLWGSMFILVLNAAAVGLGRSFAPYLISVLLLFFNALLAFVRLLNDAAGGPPAPSPS